MKLACSQVLKMHVYTASGKHVGKVKDISYDIDTGMVIEYLVASLLQKNHIIAREQVVRYEKDRLVVEDRVVDDVEEKKKKMSFSPPDPVGLLEDETPY